MDNNQTLDISWETILKIAITFFVFYFLYLLREILIGFIFALILSLLFNPVIDFLQRKKIPRALATSFVYLAIFGILGLLIYLIAPVFVSEIQQFSQLFPQYFEKFAPSLKDLGIEAFESFETFTQAFQIWLIKASASIFSAISAIFGGIFSTLTIFAIALFLSLEEKGMEKVIALLSPKKTEALVLNFWKKSQNKVSAWFGLRILCCLFVGLMTFVALELFNINYAFALSLFAGLTNLIPILGPILAGLLITVIAALDSWWKALFILITFILIQQIEGNIFTPILTKKFIGLPPVLVLISLMVGGKLWGILGAILAIPLAGILFEFTRDFLKKKKDYNPPATSSPPPRGGRAPEKPIIF